MCGGHRREQLPLTRQGNVKGNALFNIGERTLAIHPTSTREGQLAPCPPSRSMDSLEHETVPPLTSVPSQNIVNEFGTPERLSGVGANDMSKSKCSHTSSVSIDVTETTRSSTDNETTSVVRRSTHNKPSHRNWAEQKYRRWHMVDGNAAYGHAGVLLCAASAVEASTDRRRKAKSRHSTTTGLYSVVLTLLCG